MPCCPGLAGPMRMRVVGAVLNPQPPQLHTDGGGYQQLCPMSSTIGMRVLSSTLLECFGPVNVHPSP
eukprot:641784-Amphidinium_carterae.1